MRPGIGGSIAAAVMGVDRFKNRHDAFSRIMELQPYEEPGQAMRLGTAAEPIIVAEYEQATGEVIGREYSDYTRPPHHCEGRPWMYAHYDGLCTKDTDKGLECKLAGLHTAKDWGDPAHCQVPQEYYVQCLHYMIVSGRRKWDMAVWLGTEIKIYPLVYDEDLAAWLIEGERKFWHEHILTGTPPPADGSDACGKLLAWRFPRNVEPMEWADPGDVGLFKTLAEVSRNLDAEEENYAQCVNKVKAIVGAREGLRFPGGEVTWKARKDGARVFRVKLGAEE